MPATTTDQLTGTEHRLLHAVGRGRTNAEIGTELALTEDAVAGHIQHLQTKLHLRDRAALIVYAFDHGITTPQPTPAPEARLRISVLGPLRAWRGAQSLDLGPIRQQSLLAALVLRPDTTVSQSELRDRVWGLEPPLANVIQVYVYKLRKALRHNANPVIEHNRRGYRLPSSEADLDLTTLTELTTQAESAEHTGDLPTAARAYQRALNLFRGNPLPGLPGPFAETERLRLTDRRLTLSMAKARCQLHLGHEVLDDLWSLTAVHPHHEPLAALLMQALAASGRPADALSVFDRFHVRLATDLDARPGPELHRIRAAVHRGVVAEQREDPATTCGVTCCRRARTRSRPPAWA
ncbi:MULTISPECIES: BTAD domain-containing putative transcriptional regulator [unclassified Crossiella]|uniref:BTAD domain-containing putative transcriptional regulator n=1 Tax=unclassified Crossiella TaxID=2620835 RepID=UPI001FFFD103|nr:MULTISPECIES: BTAD domain-containing putative transcriptional regulator [unclassified Crossiella]MCK2241780.1 winged helix-turn-helix domain-containing protein [Crossiella sp. S99.2]MCK2255348.1 winged helix-turn-helix domain-containing protein [Crossiella sp. S99.1]